MTSHSSFTTFPFRSSLRRLVQSVDLPDVRQFSSCLGGSATLELRGRQKRLGTWLGVAGTPTFFIAGRKHYGIMSDSVFAALVGQASEVR